MLALVSCDEAGVKLVGIGFGDDEREVVIRMVGLVPQAVLALDADADADASRLASLLNSGATEASWTRQRSVSGGISVRRTQA
ncbi:hypothetical protein [Streptomyces virginiae]|uniref:hypothetical protein n=1 Tax=Streptomyces virginiae TaxID=1961 RepID=UPI00345037D9